MHTNDRIILKRVIQADNLRRIVTHLTAATKIVVPDEYQNILEYGYGAIIRAPVGPIQNAWSLARESQVSECCTKKYSLEIIRTEFICGRFSIYPPYICDAIY
jgi:hypothetical protein